MDYDARLNKTLSQKKQNANLKVPTFLKSMYLPIFLYHMQKNIKKDFLQKSTANILRNYPNTSEIAVKLSVSIYCLNSENRYLYRDLINIFKGQNFTKILQKYGDSFGAQILQEVLEDTMTEHDIPFVKNKLLHLHELYLVSKHYELFQGIREKYKGAANIDHHIVGSCDRLSVDMPLLNKYTDFFLYIKEKDDLILPLLQTTYFLTKHLGTRKVYDNFLELCEKLKQENLLPEVIHTLMILAQYGSPEIFYDATSWGCKTAMNNRLVTKIYKHSLILLDEKTKSTFSIYCFSKFISYLKDKEEKLLQMKLEDLEYYVEKAVEFFIE